MSYNTQNIDQYLKFQASIFGAVYPDATQIETTPGNSYDLSTNSFITQFNNIASSTTGIVDGQSVWNLGILDYLNGTTSLNYTPSEISPDTGSNYAVYFNNILFQWQSVNLSSNYMSLDEIYQFYQDNPYTSTNATDWNNPSTWYGDPATQQVLLYYNRILSIVENRSNDTVDSPPHTYQEFVALLQQVDMYTGAGAPNLGTGFGSLTPSVAAQLSPLLTLTPEPITQSPQAESVLASIFTQFLSNYENDYGSSAVTPSSFFTNYLSSLTSSFDTGGVTPQFQITMTIGGNNVNYSTAPVPGASTPIVGGIPTDPTAIVTQLQAEFNTALNFAGDFANNGVPLSATQQTALFNNTFAAFVSSVESGDVTVSSVSDFFTKWNEFIGPSVVLGSSNMVSYQGIYNVFFPDGTQGDFVSLLNQFIGQFLQTSSGVFNPSLMADQWFTLVTTTFFSSIGIVSGQQPLSAANFSATKILFALYALLLQMLTDLQKLTAAQASYDTFLVKYENAYTVQIAGIRNDLYGSKIPGGTDITSGTSAADVTKQTNLEGDLYNANQKYITNLTSFSSSVSDREKNNTSTFNQSVEETNQQSSLLSQILQELQSLLQSIWK